MSVIEDLIFFYKGTTNLCSEVSLVSFLWSYYARGIFLVSEYKLKIIWIEWPQVLKNKIEKFS